MEETDMIVRHRYPASTFGLDVDRAFEQLTNSFFDSRRQVAGPMVDGDWKGDEYVLTVDLPGVPASAVNVEVTGTTLVLSAGTDGMQWQRSLRLSSRLDPEQVHAHHVDGRLTVRIGTYAEPEARSIAIETTPPPAAIEANSEESTEAPAEESGESD
jgi:HSP20 family molecular chaperone IbpA